MNQLKLIEKSAAQMEKCGNALFTAWNNLYHASLDCQSRGECLDVMKRVEIASKHDGWDAVLKVCKRIKNAYYKANLDQLYWSHGVTYYDPQRNKWVSGYPRHARLAALPREARKARPKM